MSDTSSVARMGALYQEHVLLGADLEPSGDGKLMRAVSYPSEKASGPDPDGAVVSDLTGSTYVLIKGPHASELMEAAFCGPKLQPGECGWECALTAEGALTSVPLVIRTGENEYALIDPSGRGEVVVAWLGFLAQIEQNGFAPYEGTKIEDAIDMLHPLLLAGNAATKVLSDYVEHPRELPQPGQVRSTHLDKIPAVAARAPLPGASLPTYVLMVPPTRAATMWRSFLSFTEVAPAGSASLARAMGQLLPWYPVLDEKDQVKPTAAELDGWGLLREARDFVGARLLAQ